MEIVLNIAPDFFYCEEFMVIGAFALFNSPVAAL